MCSGARAKVCVIHTNKQRLSAGWFGVLGGGIRVRGGMPGVRGGMPGEKRPLNL